MVTPEVMNGVLLHHWFNLVEIPASVTMLGRISGAPQVLVAPPGRDRELEVGVSVEGRAEWRDLEGFGGDGRDLGKKKK